jgi:flavin reductase (DIM6/NTAB) family NADH-FMN oxidoreductase RutF
MFTTSTTLEESRHIQPRSTALLACGSNLMPASWHMPVSKSPFRYAVAVREENHTHQLLKASGSCTLNFLPYTYRDEVDHMGRIHGDHCNKLTQSGFEVWGHDGQSNPILSVSDFVYVCRVFDHQAYGDHTLFIADVVQIYVNTTQSLEPLLFMGRGTYATITEPVQVLCNE